MEIKVLINVNIDQNPYSSLSKAHCVVRFIREYEALMGMKVTPEIVLDTTEE